MIILLEGPDGSGKSTLAKKIAEQSNYPLIHRVAEDDQKPTVIQDYWALLNSRINMVFDRAWYSEMVYGPIFRGKAAVSYPEMFEFEKRLARVGGIIIYCTGSIATLWDRCKERDCDNPGGASFEDDFDNFTQVWHGYDRLMSVPHLVPVVRYEFKNV